MSSELRIRCVEAERSVDALKADLIKAVKRADNAESELHELRLASSAAPVVSEDLNDAVKRAVAAEDESASLKVCWSSLFV